MFTRWFVPHFGITHRYAGTEPTCVVTAGYNQAMAEILPQCGVEFVEIRRRELEGTAISASVVRAENSRENLKKLVPESTLQLMYRKNYIKGE